MWRKSAKLVEQVFSEARRGLSHGFETYLIDNPLKKTVRRDCLDN